MKGIEGNKGIKSMGEIEGNKGIKFMGGIKGNKDIKKQAGFEKLWIWQEANALTWENLIPWISLISYLT